MDTYQSAEDYIAAHADQESQLLQLRSIMQDAGLNETIKWGIPVYTWSKKNIAGIAAFKAYVGVWFFQGALLADPEGHLVHAQKGTRAMRQWRFEPNTGIDRPLLEAYLFEAIENERLGKVIKPLRNKPLVIPKELEQAFRANPGIWEQYENMKLTYRREFADFVASAKREETRLRRVAKVLPMIEQGIGLNDQYR